MYDSIGFYDWQYVLGLFEAVAWAAVIGAGLVILLQYKPKILTKQNKQAIWAIFAAWAIASVTLAGINTYNYFHNQRQSINQAINQQGR